VSTPPATAARTISGVVRSREWFDCVTRYVVDRLVVLVGRGRIDAPRPEPVVDAVHDGRHERATVSDGRRRLCVGRLVATDRGPLAGRRDPQAEVAAQARRERLGTVVEEALAERVDGGQRLVRDVVHGESLAVVAESRSARRTLFV
jgi:hypothetical protein